MSSDGGEGRTIMDVSKAGHMDPTCMLKAAQRLDLTVNLFRDGVNGSYRTLPLNVRSSVTEQCFDCLD